MIHSTETPAPIAAARRLHHPDCCVCQPRRPWGLRVCFESPGDGTVVAHVDCRHDWQGYPGVVHGGVLASLIDGSMTNWLFARNVAAVTVGLHVQYREPVAIGQRAIVRAELERDAHPRYALTSTIRQRGVLCVTATGHFVEQRIARPNDRTSRSLHG